jgi:signal-transduction protein with cAMP-binding, CBS, and nucleotidyltransferase domain
MGKVIRDVMSERPITLSADATLADAARAMREGDFGSVIILNADGSICGIVTDRDLVVRGIAQGRSPTQSTLADLCSREMITLTPDQEIDEAVNLMREKAVRRLPVQEGGRPVGIVSLGDLARERDEKSVLGQISSQPANR